MNNDFEFNYNYDYDYGLEEIAPTPAPKKKKGRKIFAAIMAVVLIMGATAGGTWAVLQGSADQSPAATQVAEESTFSAKPVVQSSKMENGSMSIPDIAETTTPSVVGILSEIPAANMYGFQEEEGQNTGTGSGIIMSEDGYIITNAHVINGATKITVVTMDKKEYAGKVIGKDTQSDLAVVKIEAKGLKPATFGKSTELRVGETVIAIGNPLGMEFAGSVTQGIVSALDREIQVDDVSFNLIQTDASINPGNSGGALVNSSGQVIGINSIKIVSSSAEGMGFAIPIDTALPIVNELIQKGYISGRPQIGITGRDVDEQTAQMYNFPQGVYVQEVSPDSAAQKAGIKQSDIITGVNGTTIKTMSELNKEKNKHKAGDKITLDIYRSGQKGQVDVILGESKEQ